TGIRSTSAVADREALDTQAGGRGTPRARRIGTRTNRGRELRGNAVRAQRKSRLDAAAFFRSKRPGLRRGGGGRPCVAKPDRGRQWALRCRAVAGRSLGREGLERICRCTRS